MKERSKTGIEGLDKALNGGIPEGNIVLLSGGAGTGKSTISLQYLINGAVKYGEKGLYISTEQQKKEIYKTADSFGWDIKKLEDEGKLKIIYFDIVETDGFLEKIYDIYTTFLPKRVVIDSLTTLTDSLLVSGIDDHHAFSAVQIAEKVSPIPKSERIISKTLLYHLVKKLRLFNSTIILTSELLEGQEGLSADQISEFICDGVMVLKVLIVGDSISRTLEIKKMRYSHIENGSMSVEFGSNGLEVA